MKRAAIYARVSTTEQADSGSSLADQVAACTRKAGELGYKVVEVIREDHSGGVPFEERPKAGALWKSYLAGHFDAIMCFDIDRATRTDEDLRTLRHADRHGDGFLFVHFEGKGPAAELMRGIKAQFAQYERAVISQRTNRGRVATWKKGGRGSGSAPYGFTYDQTTKRWARTNPKPRSSA